MATTAYIQQTLFEGSECILAQSHIKFGGIHKTKHQLFKKYILLPSIMYNTTSSQCHYYSENHSTHSGDCTACSLFQNFFLFSFILVVSSFLGGATTFEEIMSFFKCKTQKIGKMSGFQESSSSLGEVFQVLQTLICVQSCFCWSL